MTTRLKLVFFGLPLAAWLLNRDGHDVRLAVLAPIRGVPGRRRLVRSIGPERVVDPGVAGEGLEAIVDDRLAKAAPDLVVSWFWTRKLPARWLGAARLGGVGVHPSLLPRHRGADPYFWAIDGGDRESGVTLHLLTTEYDEGSILEQAELPIEGRNAWQLARALDRPSLRLLREGVPRFAQGRLTPTAQDPSLATWAPVPEGPLLRVTWSWTTERVLRRIRALSPVPGLALELVGVPLFVTGAEVAGEFPRALEPGEAGVQGDPPARALIRTGDGAIAITRAVLVDGADGPGAALDARAVAELVAGRRA